MLVDNHCTLNRIFRESEVLIATHCEDERIIKKNYESLDCQAKIYRTKTIILLSAMPKPVMSLLYGHTTCKKIQYPACIFCISAPQKELQLFGNMLPLEEKRITSEVCVHHLHFTADDYEQPGL